ncbi:hypothetical protein DL766_008611 [Monosporascus sp. MC13-8B]|nr:hypothetical protein DL763_004621 [Monosporascus cannonballus]RYP18713.1 hypothetical protein DL766_008611 [Monosporascus sp. MC13-8B]
MSDDPMPKDVILKDRFSYPDWYLALRYNALSRGVWHLIDPDAPGVDPFKGARTIPSLEQYTADINARARAKYQADLAEWEILEQGGTVPQAPRDRKADDLRKDYETDLKRLATEYQEQAREVSRIEVRYANTQTWINATVESKILRNAQTTLVIRGKTTIQDLLRELRDQFAPSELSTITTVREEYRKVLRLAEVGHMKPDQWHRAWFSAYTQAKAFDPQEVSGTLAAKDFLSALMKRLAPSWAQRELTELVREDFSHLRHRI